MKNSRTDHVRRDLGRVLSASWRDTDIRRGRKIKADALKNCRKESKR